MTPLHTRLRAAEDHLRRTAEHLEGPLRTEVLAHADAVAEAAADALLDDTRLYLPVDFVRQQQAGLEARIKTLEAERENWRVSSVCREKEAELVSARALLQEIATVISERAVGHAIMYSDRITVFLPRIKALLGADAAMTK